jgi:hypothetical protein
MSGELGQGKQIGNSTEKNIVFFILKYNTLLKIHRLWECTLEYRFEENRTILSAF